MSTSSNSSLSYLQLLLVSEKDDVQGGLFREYFHHFPNVRVTKNPFEDLEVVDCLAIPCPSSFAAKGNDITDQYMNRLPDRTKERITKHIQYELFGEQQPGTAFIVKNSGKHEKYKYVAFLCLSRMADSQPPLEYSYNAMRGLFLSIVEFNKTSQSPIEVIALPAFTLNGANPEQKRQATRHMSLAYRNMLYPMRHLASLEEAKILTAQLCEKSAETPAERKSKTREMLVNGELLKRGLYNEDELKFLVDSIETEGDLRLTSAKALAHFVHSSTSDFTLSRESICSAISKSKTGLQYMLDEAESGSFSLFTEIPPSEITLGEEIGSGTEASVYRAVWGGNPIAVKKFRGIPSSNQFRRELSIMSLMAHPNLLKCHGGYSDTKKDEYYLVIDLMETDVHQALHSGKNTTQSVGARPASPGPFSAATKHMDQNRNADIWDIQYPHMLKIASGTARGLEYLHACNLIHRDLKSVNLLIDSKFNTKVCDFGLSRIIAPKNQNMTGNVGTVSWIAPEVFEKQPYDAKADVYSFGIVMWELYTKQIPFQDMNTFEIPMAVIKGDRPPIPKDCPKEYSKLMQLCWHKKPSKRPTFEKIVQSLLKLSKSIGMETVEPPSSPAPMLHRAIPQSHSAITIRAKMTPELRSSDSSIASFGNFSLASDDSATTSSSKSEDDDRINVHHSPAKPGSSSVPSFPRRRASAAADHPKISSKKHASVRGSSEMKRGLNNSGGALSVLEENLPVQMASTAEAESPLRAFARENS